MTASTLRSLAIALVALCLATTHALAAGKTIIGSTKPEVDAILAGWPSRLSNRATEAQPMYYYTKDVELIVKFAGGKAVGVAVVDRPGGAGLSPIPERRFKELVALIGGGDPKAGDVTREGADIREFSVGDAD